MAAADDRRRVPVARRRRLHLRVRHGLDRLSRRVRPPARPDRQAAQAAHAVLRHARGGRDPVEDLVRRAPARVGGLRRDHQRDPVDADDHRQLRLPHVAQLAVDAAHVHRRPDRRHRHPLLQPAAAPHRARHPGPLGVDDAGARGADRRPPRRPRVRRRGIRARPRRGRGEPAAQRDDEGIVGDRGELAADRVLRRVRRRLDRLDRAAADRRRPLRLRALHVLHRRAAHAAGAAEGPVRHQRGDPARHGRRGEHLRPARPRGGGGHRHRRARALQRRSALRAPVAALLREGPRSAVGHHADGRARARRSRSSARRAAARLRSSTSCRGSTSRPRGACSSTATT